MLFCLNIAMWNCSFIDCHIESNTRTSFFLNEKVRRNEKNEAALMWTLVEGKKNLSRSHAPKLPCRLARSVETSFSFHSAGACSLQIGDPKPRNRIVSFVTQIGCFGGAAAECPLSAGSPIDARKAKKISFASENTTQKAPRRMQSDSERPKMRS